MAELNVEIVSEERSIWSGAASAVSARTVNGEIGILPGHTPMLAVLGDGDNPTVTSVGLGNVNGVTLAVGAGVGDATAVKDGKNYKITGNASGVDMSNPMAGAVTKPFEIDVTCP